MKKTKPDNKLCVSYKVWLSSDKGQGVMGDGRWLLLKTIDEAGSLKAAADKLHISYRKAWGDIRKAEKFIGFALIERHRGGSFGGNTILTNEGKKIIAAYGKFHKHVDSSIHNAYEHYLREIK